MYHLVIFARMTSFKNIRQYHNQVTTDAILVFYIDLPRLI